MKILFTGLPYFGKKLVDDLNEFDRTNRYIFCDTYYSKKDRLRFLFHLPTASRVVSFNGVSAKSRALNWALFFKKKLVMQWHGTDVLTLKKNKLTGNFTSKYIAVAKGLTDAKWLMEELSEAGIHTKLIHFKYAKIGTTQLPFKGIGVFSYMAQGKEEFYGWKQLEKLVRENPEISFHMAGSDGHGLTAYQNVTWHGWIPPQKFLELLDSNPIFIRFAEHDGYALSVMEALANGNYVIWNRPHSEVNYADEYSLAGVFESVKKQIEDMSFQRNSNGIKWVSEHHQKDQILNTYIREITR